MIEAANALNEVITTYEPQGPNEVLELQQIPKIPEAEPLTQKDANPGKIYYYKKLKTNKILALCLKLMKKINNDIRLYFFESLPQNRWYQSHYYLFC
jgi:hypothetical protein